ncbi:MAG TPA: UDP-galactose phosphate transferase [Actinobacteria bacterium]|nr:UDP-galactose phosphate transferase [Actinomycetota bacterium]
MYMRYMRLKQIIDYGAALIGLLLLSPVLIGIAVIIRIIMGKPVLFRQTRPGRDGKPFTMLKFRSMKDIRDDHGALLPDSERLTKFGDFLRSTSLDELPELINVIKGDMSLVGPRPLLMEYLDRYSSEQVRRHEVRPGITGWAQVNGRNTLSWTKRFEHDVWYVDNWSMWLDIKIIWLTIVKVLAREGISAQDHVTMPPFTGMQNAKKDK